MWVRERVGNVLPLDDLLNGSDPSFGRAVLDALGDAGFDVTFTFDFPNLVMAQDVEAFLTEPLAGAFPTEWADLMNVLTEAANEGVLVDLRQRPARLDFLPV